MISLIHVNRHNIAFNAKIGRPVLPMYTIKQGSRNTYARAVKIHGPSELINPEEYPQLSCGARAYIRTESRVEPIDPVSFAEVKRLKEQFSA